jgi:hypothetical protein
VPVLLVAFGVNAFFHKRLISRVMQKVIHAWILDSTAIIAGALLGSTYLNEGHIFFLDITLDNQLTIVAFSFMVYAASILTISMLTYVIHRMTRPNLEPVNDPLPSQT